MKFDLHVHSSYSHDGAAGLKELLKAAKEKNFGFAITEHNNLNSWEKLKELNKKFNVPVIPGEEVDIYKNNKCVGQLLLLFLGEEIKPGNVFDVIDNAKEQDAIISVAHPFDFLREKCTALHEIANDLHAVEVFNSRSYFNSFNSKALKFAASENLAFTAGSDAHFGFEFGKAYIECNGNNDELRREIKKCKNFSGALSPWHVHLLTQLLKFRIIKKKHD